MEEAQARCLGKCIDQLSNSRQAPTKLLKASHILSYEHVLGLDSRGLICGWLLIIFSFHLKRNAGPIKTTCLLPGTLLVTTRQLLGNAWTFSYKWKTADPGENTREVETQTAHKLYVLHQSGAL